MRSLSTMIAPSILASSRRPGGGERHVEGEAAAGDGLDGAVVAEHDQRAGAAAQDALETVAQRGAGRDRRQGRPQAEDVVGALDAGHGGKSRVAEPSSSRCQRRSDGFRAGVPVVEVLGGPSGHAEQAQRRGDVGHLDHAHPVDVARHGRRRRARGARSGRPPRRTRAGRPRRCRCGRSRTRRSSPARPISPIATTPIGAATPRVADASATRDGQVAGGLGHAGAADGRGEDVVGVEADPAVLLQHGEHHRDPRAVEPGRRTPRALGRRRASPGPGPRPASGGGPPS